eukprot:gene5809-9029_t
MPGKKGLSLEQKRSRMLDFFYETEDVFPLKTVEKRCAKEKGITSMAIKDVLQSLVDDGLVHGEKIGTSNYYWAFPSEGANIKKSLQHNLDQALSSRQDTPKRAKLLSTLENKQQEEAAIDQALKEFADCDPDMLAQRGKSPLMLHLRPPIVGQNYPIRTLIFPADNVFAIRTWCQRKFSIDLKILDKQFGIPEELDYIE